jgi:hypothetical protein
MEDTRATGRSFGTYFDQLMWPQTELVQKKRSAFINITLEDITRITDKFETPTLKQTNRNACMTRSKDMK